MHGVLQILGQTNMSSPSCVVCNSDLPTAAQRRVINPCNEANGDVHNFFVNVVSPGYKFSSSSVSYLCRVPCFSNLQKAVKHHDTLKELLGSLRANLLVPHFDDGEGASQTSGASQASSTSLQETCMEDEQVRKT